MAISPVLFVMTTSFPVPAAEMTPNVTAFVSVIKTPPLDAVAFSVVTAVSIASPVVPIAVPDRVAVPAVILRELPFPSVIWPAEEVIFTMPAVVPLIFPIVTAPLAVILIAPPPVVKFPIVADPPALRVIVPKPEVVMKFAVFKKLIGPVIVRIVIEDPVLRSRLPRSLTVIELFASRTMLLEAASASIALSDSVLAPIFESENNTEQQGAFPRFES
jgi:hypothetical protein